MEEFTDQVSIGDMDAEGLEARHLLYCSCADVDGGMSSAFSPPEVHDDLLGFLGVKLKVAFILLLLPCSTLRSLMKSAL